MDQNMMEVALDELEKKGINRYKAVLMAAQEARFINDQVRLGIVPIRRPPLFGFFRKAGPKSRPYALPRHGHL